MTTPERTPAVTDSPHAQTFERAAHTYDRVGVDFFTVFGRALVDHVGLHSGASVLDVGTGRGAVLAPAATAVGPTGWAVGVDLAPTMVELTRRDLAHLPQVEVRQADAAALPDDLGVVDAVLSSLVLFFTDDPAATLHHWAAHVAPGGSLGLVTFVPDPDDTMFRDLISPFMPPTPTPAEDAPPSPFELVRDTAWLDRTVAATGLVLREPTTIRHPTRFADVDQFMDWAWSHGMRAGLELVPEDQLSGVRDAAKEELTARRLDDGGLGLHVSIRLTVADRPG